MKATDKDVTHSEMLRNETMSKITGLYDKICDFDNLYQSYLNARKCKKYKKGVLEFSANLEERLIEMQNELVNGTYDIKKYNEFYVYDPKKRLIMALEFYDRVVQWAIYRQLSPILDSRYIYDSYGCRIGKGTHKAADRLQYWLRQVSRRDKQYYALKMDISKYFYRVDHSVLMRILESKIKDERLLELLRRIINSRNTKFGLPFGVEADQISPEDRLYEVGMPIGNLTSQMFANLYLNELDQFVKHKLKIHYYIRYVDDFIILGDDKEELWKVKEEIDSFLKNELHLNLNNKTALRPIEQGVEFVGFRIWTTHRKLKKKTLSKVKRRVKSVTLDFVNGIISKATLDASLQSYKGILKHFNSYGFRQKLNAIYLEVIRNGANKNAKGATTQ